MGRPGARSDLGPGSKARHAARGLAAMLLFAMPAGLSAQESGVKVPALVLADGAPRCRGSAGYAADFEGRRTFLWRPQWLESIRQDPAAVKAVTDAGDKAIGGPLYSVTDKPQPVPGASPNEYASIGPYWWPDPKKADGTPYIRRDGEVNPQRDGPEFDKDRLRNLARDVRALSLAAYVSGDERYSSRAAELVRRWFLDPATRMSPNMNFAQGIPGRVDGRAEGIIEASDLATIAEAVGLIEPTGALSREELAGLRQWYADFAMWMATSENGEAEMLKTNNHGVFYDFYLAQFALFAGLEGTARSVVDSFLDFRLGAQMDRQGRFIEELKRTRSWHYSHFVVIGAAKLATIGECLDRDLWNSQLSDGRSLQTARSFLLRYAGNPESWPFSDIDLSGGKLGRMRLTAMQTEQLFERESLSGGADALP